MFSSFIAALPENAFSSSALWISSTVGYCSATASGTSFKPSLMVVSMEADSSGFSLGRTISSQLSIISVPSASRYMLWHTSHSQYAQFPSDS